MTLQIEPKSACSAGDTANGEQARAALARWDDHLQGLLEGRSNAVAVMTKLTLLAGLAP